MKIKSVRITGFRAFEKQENATFDFTKDGVITNFASIYAPNGFGKTSFFDAVEWGVTKKIQRFDRMVDFDKVRKDNDAPLLLNKASSTGKVIVETSLKNFENVINKKKVYKYNEKPINEYFQNQILTQDLIDAFLKEEKADKRYEKFLEIDKKLYKYDSAYKKIIRLLEYIKDERKGLSDLKKEEEKKLQGEIDFEQEFKKFDELNELITSLNKANENLKFVDQNTFNQTAYDNLSRSINVRMSSLEETLKMNKAIVNKILFVRDGKESEDIKSSIGLLSYLDNQNKIQKFDNQIKKLYEIIDWIDKQAKIIIESKINDENLSSAKNKLEQALKIESQFNMYSDVLKEIDSLRKNIIESKQILINSEREKLNIENERNETDLKYKALKSNLENNRSKLNQIPTLRKEFELTSTSIELLQNSINDLSKSINDEEKKKNDIKTILDEIGYFENKINDDIELLLEFKLFEKHKGLVENYLVQQKRLEKLRKEIQDIQHKIDNQNHFNKELNDFIKSGLDLIKKSNSSDCPLCSQSYGSFEELSVKILANKQLERQLKKLLEEKVEIESKVKKLSFDLSLEKEKIQKTFSSIKQPYLTNYKAIQNSIDKLNSDRKDNFEKLNKNQTILKKINLFLGESQSFKEFSTKLQSDISNIESQMIEVSNELKKNEKVLSDKDTFVKSTKDKIANLEQSLQKYQNSQVYIQTLDYFKHELNTNVIALSVLSQEISNQRLAIKDFIGKKETQKKSLAELKVRLSNFTLSKTDYTNEIQQLRDSKNQLIQINERYENLIYQEFDLKIKDKNKSQIDSAFHDLFNKYKLIEKQNQTKIQKYKELKIINDACIKATESKKIQDAVKEITQRLRDLGNSEKILISEKDNLKSYLKKTIETYFYTELINAIYNKIDPHPDYKEIQFECDFAEKKPRLQIYTTSINAEGEESRAVPSLYFSTAQVNILSLSIFLARALKTRDNNGKSVDCIFIDDPIQSMDSINILSFIDLFRGIISSLNKQLIVSTHEENFHLLLQKKIPSELFNSKFIEFETYGKLKSSSV